MDESTDISDTAQLAIYVRGVDTNLHVTEELLDLVPMKDTTRGTDLLKAVEEAVEAVGLNWKMLVSVTTDGAPVMRGAQNGLVALLRKKLQRSTEDLYRIHCFVHKKLFVLNMQIWST